MVFVCSMGDLFHEDVSYELFKKVFRTMQGAFWHAYLILTKQPERMRDYMYRLYDYDDLSDGYSNNNPFPNIWFGVTAENQTRADERIPLLLSTPAVKRFISVEPMLSDIHLRHDWSCLDWVICGAETGPGKRPMKNSWAKSLQEQCAAAGIPFFFKKDSNGAGSLNKLIYRDYPA